MKTAQEGVVTLFNKDGELTGILYKDMISRKNVMYSCKEMSMEEIEETLKNNEIKI